MWTSSETTAGRHSDKTAAGTSSCRFPGTALRRILVALAILPFFLAAAILPGPAGAAARTRPAKGVYHLVKKGETLSGIARAYGINADAIREANGMSRKDHLEADRALFIPGAKKVIDDTRPRTSREKEPAAGKERAGPKRSAGKAVKPEPAPGKTAASAKVREQKEKEPKERPGTGPSAAPAKAAAKAPVRGEETRAPAGRITIAEGRVYVSEADREKAEQAAAEEKKRAADALKASRARAEEKADRTRETAVRPKEDPQQAKTQAPAVPAGTGKETATATARTDAAEPRPETAKRKKLLWPVKGKVLTRFGPQPNGMYSNGIRIAAREGTAVLSAEEGTVIFSAPLKDYGETVILRHDDAYATVYTNLGNRQVNADDRVRAGSRIGSVGRDHRTGSGALHFEVRVKNKACNPLLFLN